ncbi:pitrilysin family protein [Aestuariivivens sp. NBU2969]|uniref:M16 family metallopeptidase n=1 Tax=Aestuariivivens sp. NBU2969 TaxID=2873267 RepID=UPI001CBF8A93|nr:insulinase family protein [Aestuariivivens sp. NBU2969]
MKNCITLLSIFFFLNLTAQNTNNNLPIDNSIKKGVLPNGMTYYLHSTDVTNDVASYYIIQNVGSILENDDQQGLAHFLEHMAFNGTKHFEGKGILNTLEKEGIVFGKDINAYTSFDETVYNVNNIPTTPELIETGLQILHDWSNYLLLTEDEIDAERGVIKEEWRTRQNGRMRIFQQTIGTAFGNSKYAERLPIGKMDIVENFEYKALRDFYHDWYRTDLQAIAIIGDFDLEQMETKIKEKFSAIPAVDNPLERYVVEIEDNESLAYAMAMDNEVSSAGIQFNIRHDKPKDKKSIAYLRENILNGIVIDVLTERFNEIKQQPEAPFIDVYTGFRGLSRAHNQFIFGIIPKEGKQQEAFKLAMLEINRAVKFGFTKAEIQRSIIKNQNNYENQIARLDDRGHGEILGQIQANYLDNEPITDITKEYEIAKGIFNEVTQNILLSQIQKLYSKNNRNVIVTGVEGKNNLTEAQTIEIINEVENDTTLQPYQEEEELKSLMAGVELTSGKIVKTESQEELGFTTYTLSNGVKVHYQFVDKQKNNVALRAHSYGGNSLINTEDLPSANMMLNVIGRSGLGEFSATELPKVLAGKTASVNLSLGDISESISGFSTTKDVETMLQLLNLHFTKPRFDEVAYNVFLQNLDNYLLTKSKDLRSKISDSITVSLYGNNNPYKRLFDKNYVSDIDFDKMKRLYSSRFSNAADFEFVIVGDVKEDSLKPLLERYIASLPTTKEKEHWKDNSVEWLSSKIDKDIFLPMEDPKASVRIAIKNNMSHSVKNSLLMDALGSILQLRYTESLREQEGGTYGASARGSLYKEPLELAYLSISFDCNPDLAEKLIGIVYKEIEKIKQGEIQQNDLDKVLTNFLKEREESKSFNRYELSAISTWIIDGYNRNAPENFENIVNSITKKDIQDLTIKLLEDHKSYEIVFKPTE